MADNETYVKTEVVVDPNVKSEKTPRCPKCHLTNPYITHFAMEKRVCIKCDKDEIADFNSSTIVDSKGLPYRPAKGRVINANGVSGDGSAKAITQAEQAITLKKTRKPRVAKTVSEETTRVKKAKPGLVVIEILVDYLIGKGMSEINLIVLEGLHSAIGELPMATINEAEKIIGLRKLVEEILKANKSEGGK